MVRAAAGGVIDYSRADPRNGQWRLKHRLLLSEIERQDNYRLLDAVHRQWLSHVSHGSLTEESYRNVKERANETLEALQRALFPWWAQPKTEGQTDTIKPEYHDMIERYKRYQESLQNGEE